MASSEPSTSRLPEEDSSDIDSDSDNEVSQIDIDSQISTSTRSSTLTVKSLHLSGLLSLQKCNRVSIIDSMQRLSRGPQLRERDLLLGRGGTRDLRRHQEACVLLLQSYFGPIREESVILVEVLFAYFLGEHHLAFQLRDHFTKLFKLIFPDSAIAKDFKCRRTKATAVLKVIAQNCWKTISAAVRETKYFSLQTDETTDIIVAQQAAIMLRFFDNTQGQVRCVFFALESVERETAELLFNAIDKAF